MSGVKMIQDNTKTCLNNLERSLLRCKAFLQHRCIPKECAEATSVRPLSLSDSHKMPCHPVHVTLLKWFLKMLPLAPVQSLKAAQAVMQNLSSKRHDFGLRTAQLSGCLRQREPCNSSLCNRSRQLRLLRVF